MANLFVSTRRALLSALVLVTPSCGYDLPTTPVEPGAAPRTSWMSANVEGSSWNAWVVSARRMGEYLMVTGTMWVDDEATLAIRLEIKAVAGATPQVIDSSSAILASIVYDPTYQPRQAWTSFGTAGSGTFTVSTLSETRATGTFSFTARATSPNTVPQDYRVTQGTFDVAF